MSLQWAPVKLSVETSPWDGRENILTHNQAGRMFFHLFFVTFIPNCRNWLESAEFFGRGRGCTDITYLKNGRNGHKIIFLRFFKTVALAGT